MLDLEDIATREVAMMKHDGGDAIVELTCGGLSPDPDGPAPHRRRHRRAPDHGLRLLRQRLPGCAQPRSQRRRFRRRDDRPDPARRLGHRRACRHDRRDRLPGTVDRSREESNAGRPDRCFSDGAAINVHPGAIPTSRGRSPTSSRRQGIRPRVVISHIDRTIFDVERLLRLADSGASRSSSTCSARKRATMA